MQHMTYAFYRCVFQQVCKLEINTVKYYVYIYMMIIIIMMMMIIFHRFRRLIAKGYAATPIVLFKSHPNCCAMESQHVTCVAGAVHREHVILACAVFGDMSKGVACHVAWQAQCCSYQVIKHYHHYQT